MTNEEKYFKIIQGWVKWWNDESTYMPIQESYDIVQNKGIKYRFICNGCGNINWVEMLSNSVVIKECQCGLKWNIIREGDNMEWSQA